MAFQKLRYQIGDRNLHRDLVSLSTQQIIWKALVLATSDPTWPVRARLDICALYSGDWTYLAVSMPALKLVLLIILILPSSVDCPPWLLSSRAISLAVLTSVLEASSYLWNQPLSEWLVGPFISSDDRWLSMDGSRWMNLDAWISVDESRCMNLDGWILMDDTW